MKLILFFRAWFYFRSGYGSYFAFAIGLANMYTITYYLFIDNTTFFIDIFPSFSSYIIICSVIGIPLMVILGFIHIKRSPAFKSDMSIVIESNPYNYQSLPGITLECYIPLYLQLLRLGKKSLSGDAPDAKELKDLDILMSKLKLLSSGGSLTIPKTFKEI